MVRIYKPCPRTKRIPREHVRFELTEEESRIFGGQLRKGRERKWPVDNRNVKKDTEDVR